MHAVQADPVFFSLTLFSDPVFCFFCWFLLGLYSVPWFFPTGFLMRPSQDTFIELDDSVAYS